MIKQGDRVYPYYNMGQVGRVVLIERSAVTAHTVGGALSAEFVAHIELKDGSIIKHRVQDLMREE
jgi:hypothetical protein